ncbi:MAG TPA: hypothetical protein VM938_10750 [Acidimicrobiales bacterium]|nr:hypothetical protein [Acidimicrobiales bacterium]
MTVWIQAPRVAEAAPKSPVEILGTLPQPDPEVPDQPFNIAAIDPVSQRMFGMYAKSGPHMVGPVTTGPEYTTYLVEYDLRPRVPTFVAKRPLLNGTADASPLKSAVDLAGKRLFFTAPGDSILDSALYSVGIGPDAAPVKKWTMTEKLPGYFIGGITYSAEDNRIYAVGEMSTTVLGQQWGYQRKPAGMVSTVAAFSPDDGSLLWAKPVPECNQPLWTMGLGALIARSSPKLGRNELLFTCAAGSTGSSGNDNFPNQPGVVELAISPTATAADAALFDLQFHPVAGTYFDGGANGIASYDYGSDRLFVQSLSSTTPNAWVFDARLGTWVGSITSPDDTNYIYGLNQTTGHYYMGGGSEDKKFLLITDGRATPPQNGVVLGPDFAPSGLIVADPTSDRMFVPMGDLGRTKYRVLRDLTESVRPEAVADYDSLTDDIPEATDTYISFSGDAAGFGTRVSALGDTANVVGFVPRGRDALRPESRGVVLGRVPTVTVQPAGAAAAAQQAGLDTTSTEAAKRNAVPWNYPSETCLDGGSTEPAEPTGSADSAQVKCALKEYEGTAVARHAGAAGAGLAVGESVVNATVKRTVKDGMRTHSVARSSGIGIDVPGAGRLEIGSVEVTAATVAHGRRGTASAEWTRTLRGVVVKDAKGAVVLDSPGCTTKVRHDGHKLERSGDSLACEQLAEAVRRALQTRVRLFFPDAAVHATPKGAFAGIGQSAADFAKEVTLNDQGKLFGGDTTTRRAVPAVQVDIYNDSAERSRTIVQFAGVENTSVFTVNRNPDEPPCHTGGCIPGGSDGLPAETASGPDGTSGGLDASSDLGTSAAGSGVAQGVRGDGLGGRPSAGTELAGLIVTRRGLGEGLLMAAFIVLLGSAVGGVTRRRRLTSVLTAR